MTSITKPCFCNFTKTQVLVFIFFFSFFLKGFSLTFYSYFLSIRLSVGRGGESEAFLTYNVNSDSSFDPEYVGFTTGSGVGMFGNIRAHDSCLGKLDANWKVVTAVA